MYIIQIQPNAKAPVGAWQPLTDTQANDAIAQGYNLAVVATETHLVIDLDLYKAPLVHPLDNYPHSKVNTPSKGAHYIYRVPQGYTPPKRLTIPNIDLQHKNRYALIPPSTTAKGAYTWATDTKYNDAPLLPSAIQEWLDAHAAHKADNATDDLITKAHNIQKSNATHDELTALLADITNSPLYTNSFFQWRDILLALSHEFYHDTTAKDIIRQWCEVDIAGWNPTLFEAHWVEPTKRVRMLRYVGLKHRYGKRDGDPLYTATPRTPYEVVYRSAQSYTADEIRAMPLQDIIYYRADDPDQTEPQLATSQKALAQLLDITSSQYINNYSAVVVYNYYFQQYIRYPVTDPSGIVSCVASSVSEGLQLNKLTPYRTSSNLSSLLAASVKLLAEAGIQSKTPVQHIAPAMAHIQAIIDHTDWDGVDRDHLWHEILTLDLDQYGVLEETQQEYRDTVARIMPRVLINYVARNLYPNQYAGEFRPMLAGQAGCGKSGFVAALLYGTEALKDSPLEHIMCNIVPVERIRQQGILSYNDSYFDWSQKLANTAIGEIAEVGKTLLDPKQDARLQIDKAEVTSINIYQPVKHEKGVAAPNTALLLGTMNHTAKDYKMFQLMYEARRYLYLPVESINHQLWQDNYQQLWAQAIHYARLGERINHTKEELDALVNGIFETLAVQAQPRDYADNSYTLKVTNTIFLPYHTKRLKDDEDAIHLDSRNFQQVLQRYINEDTSGITKLTTAVSVLKNAILKKEGQKAGDKRQKDNSTGKNFFRIAVIKKGTTQ